MNDTGPRRVPLDLPGVGGPVALFRVSGAVRHDAAVDRWLGDDSNPQRDTARFWFAWMQQCGEAVLAVMHDGCAVACIEDAPFAYVNTFSRHASVGFFYGALLPDPAGLLEGTGKRMRHVKLHPGRPVNADALRSLIEVAYADVQSRLAAAPSRQPRAPSPEGMQ